MKKLMRDRVVPTIAASVSWLTFAVIGCGALHVMWEDLAEVRTLAVAPAVQGRGIGAALLSRLGLPPLPALDPDELISHMARDKKALDGLTFVLDGPRGVEVVPGVTSAVIGPTWGQDVSQKALVGLVVFLVLVSLVMTVYFRNWRMAAAAVIGTTALLFAGGAAASAREKLSGCAASAWTRGPRGYRAGPTPLRPPISRPRRASRR